MNPGTIRRHGCWVYGAAGTLNPYPTITSLSSTVGDTGGGASVVITGTGFTSVTFVKFGTTAAASYVVDSSTQITAVSPAHAAGSGAVTVNAIGGTSSGSAYEFWDPSVPATPTLFLKSPNYSTAGATGLWTATTGPNAAEATNYPDSNPAGTAKFISANTDRLLLAGGTTMEELVGRASTQDATMMVVLDVVTIPSLASVIMMDNDFYGGMYMEPAGTITFASYQGSYKYATATIPTSGRVVACVKRVSGVLKITIDGTTWITGDTVGTMSTSGANVWLGYTPVANYPLNSSIRTVITAKSAWSDANVAKAFTWAASLFT